MTRNGTIHDQPDPRSPLVLDTRELGRRAGSMRRVAFSIPAPAGLGLDLIGIGVGEATPLDLDLRVEAVQEGVLVTGAVSATAHGQCARCLRPIAARVAAELQELYAYPDSATVGTTEQDEVGRVVDDRLDLEPAVHDAVVLALPGTPLCREDCPGLCATCGELWEELPPGHRHEVGDPRWSTLLQMAVDTYVDASVAEPRPGRTRPAHSQES